MRHCFSISAALAAVLAAFPAPGMAQASDRILKSTDLDRIRRLLAGSMAVQRIRGAVVDTVAVPRDTLRLHIGEVLTFIASQGVRRESTATGTHVDTPLRIVGLDAQ